MAKERNQFEREAREMAQRIEDQRQMGHQLDLLADLDEDEDSGEQQTAGGRPKGAKNKSSSQLREWLAHQGLRMPEDVLTEIAGLRSRDDAITLAMARTERLLAWAFDGAHQGKKAPPKATAPMRLAEFGKQYAIILRAVEAMLPYVAAKASPDVIDNRQVNVIVPAMPAQPASGDPASRARDVTPQAPRLGRMVPADMADEILQKQGLNSGADGETRTGSRTDGAND